LYLDTRLKFSVQVYKDQFFSTCLKSSFVIIMPFEIVSSYA